jgi:hypothetical protein
MLNVPSTRYMERGKEQAETKPGQARQVVLVFQGGGALEDHTAATERLMGAKSLEKASEVQSGYVKMAFEGFVAHATKIGKLYADLAKELYKPIEGVIGRNPFAS